MIETNTFNPYDDVFCIAPWSILEIRPDGKIKPCCASDYVYGDIKESSLWDIWNDTPIKKFRKWMMSGVPHPTCENCYVQECTGNDSHREYFNRKFFDTYKDKLYQITNEDGSISEPMFLEWHVRLSNKCNFKCRMCNPQFSSSIELEEMGEISGLYDTSDKTYEEVEPYLANMEELCFVGGEPLIIDQHYQILDKLIKLNVNDKIILSYCTNFSVLLYKKRHVFDLWEKFSKKVCLYLSIDAIGERGELIRDKSNWEKILSNIKQFKEKFGHNPDTYELVIQPTFQALNIFNIVDLHQFLYKNKFIENIDSFLVNFLSDPPEMSVWILDEQTKKEAIIHIQNHIDRFLIPNKASLNTIDQFKSMINYINLFQYQYLIPNFLKSTKKYDILRNQNTKNIFPELHRIWELYDKIE